MNKKFSFWGGGWRRMTVVTWPPAVMLMIILGVAILLTMLFGEHPELHDTKLPLPTYPKSQTH
jgi:hypothetical protein